MRPICIYHGGGGHRGAAGFKLDFVLLKYPVLTREKPDAATPSPDPDV